MNVCPDLIYVHREHVRNIFQIVDEYYKFGIFLNYNNGRCEHKSVQFHVLLDIDQSIFTENDKFSE